VKISRLHRWDLDYRPGTGPDFGEAAAVQARLAARVIEGPPLERAETVAAADVSAGRKDELVAAVVVVMRLGSFEVVEVRRAAMRAAWPYVPGMLSFREAPVVLAAFRQVRTRPDVVLVDGQGRAHPRRMGLASHLGLALGVPTVGCAKSRLIGEMAGALGQARGSRAPLVDAGERVGTVLRTRAGTRPVYVSVGSGLDLASAERWVLASAPRYRLPEPARLAHQLVTQYKRSLDPEALDGELTARGNP
jgi:deoxyribonuclease V